MAQIGDGISTPAVEQDPSIAQIQAATSVALTQTQVALPATGFVASLNSLSGVIIIQAGTSSPGVTVTISSDGVTTLSIGVTGISAAGTAKGNIIAAAPTIANDESEGYAVFSLWIDNTVPATPTIYICSDPASGAAIWTALN